MARSLPVPPRPSVALQARPEPNLGAWQIARTAVLLIGCCCCRVGCVRDDRDSAITVLLQLLWRKLGDEKLEE